MTAALTASEPGDYLLVHTATGAELWRQNGDEDELVDVAVTPSRTVRQNCPDGEVDETQGHARTSG